MNGRPISEIEELIGAYALDAVDADEREVVEQHLAVCARCRAELADAREVAALLAYDGALAPDDLWDRIVADIDDAPPAMRLELAVPDDAGAHERRPVPLDERRRDRQTRRWYVAVAGVAAAAALVLGVVVVRQDDQASSPVALSDLADEARATPGATTATLRPPDGGAGPEATAVVTPDGRGFLDTSALPALPSDRTYQLWGVVGDQVISLGVLGAAPDVTAFQVDDAARVSAYAVTDEVAGGVVSSSNPAVVVGESA